MRTASRLVFSGKQPWMRARVRLRLKRNTFTRTHASALAMAQATLYGTALTKAHAPLSAQYSANAMPLDFLAIYDWKYALYARYVQ